MTRSFRAWCAACVLVASSTAGAAVAREPARASATRVPATASSVPGAALAQTPDSKPSPSPARSSDVRRAALDRDPATFPRAAADRWKGFDPKSLTPESVPAEFKDVGRALAEGDLPLAIVKLVASLDREPDFPPALHQLGVVYFQLQRYGDARACFDRYLAVVPDRVADTRGLAHALYSLGRYEEARAHYQRVLAAAPDDVEALRGLALTRYRLGDVATALVELTRVLERDPEHADAWTWKSQMLLDLDKADEARVAAERARDLAPWAPRAWFALASALNDLGRADEARAARERFDIVSRYDQDIRRIESHLEHWPGDTGARRELASALAAVGNRRALRTNVAHLVAERPDDVATRIFALDVCDRAGDVEAGRVAARDLERVGVDSVSAWKRLEAWYGARRERTKQMQAGERWRRASQP